MRIAAGQVLASRYRADALLGQGGMGEVWRCFDLEEQRDVAVKTVLAEHLANPNIWRLFQAEVIAVARLSHPGIVEVYDLLSLGDGTSLLVMEYRPGKALDEALRSVPSWSLVRAVFVQLLDALAHAHARSVLHLDIKPGNVIVEKLDDTVHATLVDFGIARVKQPGRGAEKWFDSAVIVGTLEYMAPEQCRGELERLGPWSDLYALGMMAYELTSGDLPHPCDDPAEAIRRRVSEPAPLLVPRINSVPPGFEELCAWLLALEPRDRPACAADVLAELERIDPHDARRSDLRGLSSRPPAMSITPAESETEATVVMARGDGPTMLAREHLQDVFAELDREEATRKTTGAWSLVPPSSHRAGEAEIAFTAERSEPTPGAYGLFGLRELPVLGRVEERRALWSGVSKSALDGLASAVVLVGPAGTGKTRVARDAVERSLELGLCQVMHTNWSAGGSADEGLRGMLENALESRGRRGEEFEARLDFWLERLVGQPDSFGHEVRVLLRPEQDAAPDAALPVRAAVEAVARLAERRPLLLWLDDVQWSRGEATALVEALARRTPVPAVCVLATVREEELEGATDHQAFLAAVGKLCAAAGTEVVQVPMRPLGQDAARAMVRGLLNLEPELRELIAQRSEGNPLFATQLVRQLVVERAIVARGRRYGLAPGVDAASILPADIGAVWARRIALSRAPESDLRALAVVRERVSLEVADALVKRAGDSLALSIDRALSAGLLVREGARYGWAHGLLRDYLVGRVHADESARLHGWAADALEPLVGREDVQEERALHLAAAQRPRAACEAMLDAAIWCWRRAEREARERRLERLSGWAEEDGFVDLHARALAELGFYFAEGGELDRASALISRAQHETDPKSHGAAAWVDFREAQLCRLRADTDKGVMASRSAIEHAQRSGDFEIEAASVIQLALDAYRRGDNETALPLLDEALRLARLSRNRAVEALVLINRSLIGEPTTQERLRRDAIAMAREAGALRVELAARQLWVDALWRVDERERARAEAMLVSREAARRSLRQIVSIIELQSACWSVEEQDWTRTASHRGMAAEWGAASGALPERATLAALDVVLALAQSDEAAAAVAVDRLLCEAKGYGEDTFRDLVRKAVSMAPRELSQRIEAVLA